MGYLFLFRVLTAKYFNKYQKTKNEKILSNHRYRFFCSSL